MFSQDFNCSEYSDEALRTRKYLKNSIFTNKSLVFAYENQRKHIEELFRRASADGESNSAILIGPRGSGKTALICSILRDFLVQECFMDSTMIVYLNGLIHTDDKLALASIAVQLKLENTAEGKVFGSFAENLEFLLSSLRRSDKKTSKSVIFLLEEFDLFCSHHNQTLLYNLFDVSQSPQVPVCVLGVTSRLDVMELLEKRVKSRFSHRQLFLFPTANEPEKRIELCRESLMLPTTGNQQEGVNTYLDDENPCEFHFLRLKVDDGIPKLPKGWIQAWNKHIDDLTSNDEIRRAVITMYEIDCSHQSFKTFLMEITSLISIQKPFLQDTDILAVLKKFTADEKIQSLKDLSVMEFCLVISMKHHSEIYDRDPFNFEMIYDRFTKFANTTKSIQHWSRTAMFKAFEFIAQQELIAPVGGAGTKIQKEFQMFRLLLTFGQIAEATKGYSGLPTEIGQWAQSSLV
ncbi:Origin recognition complex subunit 4 [Sergentomyia squamirostris]